MNFLRLLIATCIGAAVMFFASYFWHGVVLNDFKFIQYDIKIFIGLLMVTYFFIAAALSFVLSLYNPTEYKVIKQSSIGVVLGFSIYLIIFVLGLSLSGKGLVNNMLNFTWQMIEQGIGAFVISVFYQVVHRRDKIMAFADAIDD